MLTSTAIKRDKAVAAESPVLPLPRVDGSSPMPLFLQVRTILSEAIRKGVLPPGSPLPSTARIARQLRVSLLTAHRGLQDLTEAGWLVRGRGHRTFVRQDFETALAQTPRFRIVVAMSRAVAPDDTNSWQYLMGVQSAAADLVPTTERIVHHYDSVSELKHVKADGILCIQPRPEQMASLASMSESRPIVLLGAASTSGSSLHGVATDHREAIQTAVRHLVDLGHRRIAMLGDTNPDVLPEVLHGLPDKIPGLSLSVGCGRISASLASMDQAACASRLTKLVAANRRPTAVIVDGLRPALRVHAALQQAEVEVPRQLSLVGLGDDWFTDLLAPPLTTVAQPVEEMARRAFSRLLQLLNNQTVQPKLQSVPPILVVRGTTASAPVVPLRQS